MGDRNTPTRVGKTPRILGAEVVDQKHPHTRGEDGSMPISLLVTLETPPHAWGRQITQKSSK